MEKGLRSVERVHVGWQSFHEASPGKSVGFGRLGESTNSLLRALVAVIGRERNESKIEFRDALGFANY